MFDPDEYFRFIREAIHRCPLIEDEDYDEKRLPRADTWDVIRFSWAAKFYSGQRFNVREFYTRRFKERPKRLRRNCNHQYTEESGALIFRFSTHGQDIRYEDPCCLHPRSDDVELNDGDPALKGFNLYGVDFLRAFSVVTAHLEGRGLPWE